jgi:Transcriptional regulatory protein, C terminal
MPCGPTSVQPEVLKTHIRTIRSTLGDNADKPTFIETKHGRGYRFIAKVRETGDTEPPIPDAGSLPLEERIGNPGPPPIEVVNRGQAPARKNRSENPGIRPRAGREELCGDRVRRPKGSPPPGNRLGQFLRRTPPTRARARRRAQVGRCRTEHERTWSEPRPRDPERGPVCASPVRTCLEIN